MTFSKKSKVESTIPTASMADIAFLLLIFFMVSTVFKQYTGLKVLLPQAEKTQKIETRRHITHIWINPAGDIRIDDLPVELPMVEKVMRNKLQKDPRTIISLRADKRARYGVVSDLMEELRKADALRVSFGTEREKRGD
jgi:biopolymer transport protein ExbD